METVDPILDPYQIVDSSDDCWMGQVGGLRVHVDPRGERWSFTQFDRDLAAVSIALSTEEMGAVLQRVLVWLRVPDDLREYVGGFRAWVQAGMPWPSELNMAQVQEETEARDRSESEANPNRRRRKDGCWREESGPEAQNRGACEDGSPR